MKLIVAFLFRLILKTRYTVNFKIDPDTNNIRQILKNTKSTLILPNHPAEVDPVIISAFLWNYYQPSPVVLETIFQMPVINSILKCIGAIAMPDMEQGSGFYKLKRIENALSQIVNCIQRGISILVYPSGRLSLDGREVLGGASGIHSIISNLSSNDQKDFKILLVRSTGLWGSRFSKAQTEGQRPDIADAVSSSIKTIFKNLIFFVPKRKVELALKEASINQLKDLSVSELNSFLESWYNLNGTENLNLVKDAFWQNTPKAKQKKNKPVLEQISIDTEIENKVLNHLSKLSSKNISDIKNSSLLSEDLGFDSLIIAELVLWLQEELDVSDIELSDLRTVNDLYRVIASSSDNAVHLTQKLTEAPISWARQDNSESASVDATSKNLAAAIIQSCKKASSAAALSDPLIGVKNYRDLLRAALLFKPHIQALKGDKVAILLPASATVAIISLAVWLSKKTPVYLNWTAGIKNLKHSLESLNISQIVTAGSVLDKINSDLSELNDSFVLLEELKEKFTLKSKIKVILESLLSANSLIAYLGLASVSETDPAAILFTSGSEATPKTVPLTHKNILTNVKDIFSCFEIKKSDVLFGFLPPFHSFGLTVTTILPLVGGLRVAFYPNPNESRKIAVNCYTWGISIMAGTPSFLRGVLSSAEVQAFKSLRVIMSGAERLPDDLKALAVNKAPQAQLLEGYGITECSPVVCAQRLNSNQVGVGACLPSVQIKIIDTASLEDSASPKETQDGTIGLILIKGASVFPGYIQSDKNPFITIKREAWYNSGDLGYISEGSLILTGRLKRFAKIGGEMISLPAIEETLEKVFNSGDAMYQFAVIEKQEAEENRVSLILFSNYPNLNTEQVNQTIKARGLTALSKIKKVNFLTELPTLGSGKVDIVGLKKIEDY